VVSPASGGIQLPHFGFVGAGAREILSGFDYDGVFTVGDFGQENGVFAFSVELFVFDSVDLILVIGAGAGVLTGGESVMLAVLGLVELSVHIA